MRPDVDDQHLTVAVTGPTGTFGFGLVPLLQADPRIERIVGVARRPFEPADHGWTKMDYRRGDVRDPVALEAAFDGVDVVVHLAFLIMGSGSRDTAREINVEGTLRVLRAASEVGAKRFVYASSVAAYGFHRDNPIGMDEDWPVRPAEHLFYAQEKAELEARLREEAALHPSLAVYLLRPPVVVGPHAIGAKQLLPEGLAPIGRLLGQLVRRVGFPDRLPLPMIAPALPLQLVHEDDVGEAFLLCIVGAGPPGAYNIAADDVLTGEDVVRAFGLVPVPVPAAPVQAVARAAASLPSPPPLPPVTEWIEALAQPAIMDTTKVKRELGWRPQHSAIDSLHETIAVWREGAV
jgi:nucleoside-diphosphate-sugar epimerase